ncbi:hypothetical protein HYH03_001487 [Edaphochlamys debaryana]|uniref:Mannosyltransferase putative-domain-containing protein n=1 Tax=Edaphochlamys debaryana TaxID=47281 RepID=A0A835YGD5_9CHLO|nr:hypothetical protein HYH03_001487 [Edaphochlamys debaryana]|eukprot:KAG2500723.1 hypothetical protein HYH03_001487 [Edaphochlamys debaryana]
MARSFASGADFATQRRSLHVDDVKRYWVQTAATTKTNVSVTAMKQKLMDYLLSDRFQPPAANAPRRGIVIPTGGRHYLPQAIVALRTLRHHLGCTIPVQLVWCGKDEMWDGVWSFLEREFAPLMGYDACEHESIPEHWYKGPSKGFNLKAYALLAAPFKEVMLWDSDVIPAVCPDSLFDSEEFKLHGNMFWGDSYGEGMFQKVVYKLLGLQDQVHDLIATGKGIFNRYAESGAVMVDRTRHLDMLEWAWWMNAMGHDLTYNYMYGDKDTFGVAFAMAGKPTEYYQVPVPPAGVWTHDTNIGWHPNKPQLLRQGHWWMNSLVHFSPWGQAMWQHRVTGEMYVRSPGPPRDEVVTPPMPVSWTTYHMAFAPTDGSAQFPAIVVMPYNLTYLQAISATTPATPGCPPLVWAAYWHMRTHAVPVAVNTTLEELCCGHGHAQGEGGASTGGGSWAALRQRSLVTLDTGAGAIAAQGAKHHPCWGAAGDRPHLLGINEAWERRTQGPYSGWGVPREPLWAVPLNMTELWVTWAAMNETWHWEHTQEALRPLTQNRRQ